MGIHVRSTELSFIITHRIRRILGNSELKAEIVAAPTTKPTRLNITQYSFNPQSKVAIIRGLTRGVVYNVRFFMMTGATFSGRKYFINTLIKTGRSELKLHYAIFFEYNKTYNFSFLRFSV